MVFVESCAFSTHAARYLTEEERVGLDMWLTVLPDSGTLIPGSGGLRKLRWRTGGKGKRGGVRVIYYWWKPRSLVYLAEIYSKARASNLSIRQLRELSDDVEEWLREET
jgi:mRNA-degrading endonuclease RelE of RelBE toxin-antitoxin system